jgi:hypothetical protein
VHGGHEGAELLHDLSLVVELAVHVIEDFAWGLAHVLKDQVECVGVAAHRGMGRVDELAPTLCYLSREQAWEREAPSPGARGLLEDGGRYSPGGEGVGTREPGQSGPDDGHAAWRPGHRTRPWDARRDRGECGCRDAGRGTPEELTPVVALQVRALRLNHTLDHLPRRQPVAVGVEREPDSPAQPAEHVGSAHGVPLQPRSG